MRYMLFTMCWLVQIWIKFASFICRAWSFFLFLFRSEWCEKWCKTWNWKKKNWNEKIIFTLQRMQTQSMGMKYFWIFKDWFVQPIGNKWLFCLREWISPFLWNDFLFCWKLYFLDCACNKSFGILISFFFVVLRDLIDSAGKVWIFHCLSKRLFSKVMRCLNYFINVLLKIPDLNQLQE